MNTNSIEKLKTRFKVWAVETIKFTRDLPRDEEFIIIKRQIIRSASGGAANYRAACRSKSDRDFLNKLKIVEEEMDETMFWLELLDLLGEGRHSGDERIYIEANELLSIVVASITTVRKKIDRGN